MPIDSGSTRNFDRPAMKETEDVLYGFVGASGLDQDLHSSCCFAFILALCNQLVEVAICMFWSLNPRSLYFCNRNLSHSVQIAVVQEFTIQST